MGEILRGGEQAAGLAKVAVDRSVRRVELGVDHRALASEPGPVLAIAAVVGDGEHRIDPDLLADQEVLLAMVRRHVDEAGALLGGDMVAGQERPRLGKEAAETVHRMAGDGACKIGSADSNL